MPNIVNAAISDGTLGNIVQDIIDIINIIIPILITLAIALFFYHTGKGIFGSAKDSGTAQTQLKETLLWGVGIIFVMVSIWGILNLIGSEFNLLKPRF
jgi:hypothetical protein